eukprot:TRINITY_DN7546_c0_g1_i17.p1 TRINITY_DN7546_c0_g1~~TRINITY_DN7546_c0_g1_i17.p1  ORF type:complete len:318 (-),score=35.12 TRINITY_DN7546_c0_g1_i17:59-1012(-)
MSSERLAMLKLSSELPADLLRAVPSQFALSGYGKHWRGSAGCPSDFLSSVVTENIDDFVSHDWRTPRIQKYISLSYIYNARAAVIGSTLVSFLLALLRELLKMSGNLDGACETKPILCDLGICITVGPFVYLILFFHWQSLRGRFRRNRLLFVDKLCIAQHDDDMKKQGILGLAAFLRQAQRIVVLWSPSYFSRLWCTYELAAWFRFQKRVSSVVFVPVEIPFSTLCAFGCFELSSLLLHMEVIRDLTTPFTGSTTIAGLFLLSYCLQGYVQRVDDLQQQLEQFSIQDTACFCCTMGHKDPQTGACLNCDRQMVHCV